MPGDVWLTYSIQPDAKSFVIEAYRTKKTFEQVCQDWLDRQGPSATELPDAGQMAAWMHRVIAAERQAVSLLLNAPFSGPLARKWAYCAVWNDPESHCIDPERTDSYSEGQQPTVIVFMNGTRLPYNASKDQWNEA